MLFRRASFRQLNHLGGHRLSTSRQLILILLLRRGLSPLSGRLVFRQADFLGPHPHHIVQRHFFDICTSGPRQESILLTVSHVNSSIPICRLFCCLYSNWSGSALRLPEMGAVLFFEWAFNFPFRDPHTRRHNHLHRCLTTTEF